MGKWAVKIDLMLCVGCGACIAECPVHAIQMFPGWIVKIDSEICVGCGQCVELCHRNAPKWTSY